MNTHERRKNILDIVNRQGSVLVSELAEMVGTSEVTIRSDLKFLENKKMLLRFYGGATTMDNSLPDDSRKNKFQMIAVDHDEAKNKIAEKALSFIKDHQTIIIGSGTTNAALANKIAQSEIKDLTIITNNLMAMNSLSQNKDIVLILLGGRFTHGNGSTYGEVAEKSVEGVKVDIMFTGADGLDDTGVTSIHEGFSLSATLAKYSEQVIVLTEGFKVGKRRINKVLTLSQISKIITNEDLSNKDLSQEFLNKVEYV